MVACSEASHFPFPNDRQPNDFLSFMACVFRAKDDIQLAKDCCFCLSHETTRPKNRRPTLLTWPGLLKKPLGGGRGTWDLGPGSSMQDLKADAKRIMDLLRAMEGKLSPEVTARLGIEITEEAGDGDSGRFWYIE